MTLTPSELRMVIEGLPAETPRYRDLEQVLGPKGGMTNVWYRTQKEHWIGWLNEYA